MPASLKQTTVDASKPEAVDYRALWEQEKHKFKADDDRKLNAAKPIDIEAEWDR